MAIANRMFWNLQHDVLFFTTTYMFQCVNHVDLLRFHFYTHLLGFRYSPKTSYSIYFCPTAKCEPGKIDHNELITRQYYWRSSEFCVEASLVIGPTGGTLKFLAVLGCLQPQPHRFKVSQQGQAPTTQLSLYANCSSRQLLQVIAHRPARMRRSKRAKPVW